MEVYLLKLDKNRELWVQRVKEFKDSNLSQAAWCRENKINIGALRYWIKKLDNSNTSDDKSTPIVEFASTSFASNNSSPSIDLVINDVRLILTNNYDETLLLKLIGSLKKL